MSKLSELLYDKNGFQVKLRCENFFDEETYVQIKSEHLSASKVWKQQGSVPIEDMVALMGLVEQLARGSNFYDEATAVRAEDACLEVYEIITDLLY